MRTSKGWMRASGDNSLLATVAGIIASISSKTIRHITYVEPRTAILQ